jgi:hypothetical protein
MYPGAMQLEDVLIVLDALERAGVRYAVFGGLAMAAHGFDRATRDLDLFVAPDAANVERLREALTAVFDDPDIAMITARTSAARTQPCSTARRTSISRSTS